MAGPELFVITEFDCNATNVLTNYKNVKKLMPFLSDLLLEFKKPLKKTKWQSYYYSFLNSNSPCTYFEMRYGLLIRRQLQGLNIVTLTFM